MQRITRVLLVVTICIGQYIDLYGQHGQVISVARSNTSWIPIGSKHTFVAPMDPSISQLSYTFESDTSSQWQAYWRYPKLSLHAYAHDLGNASQLGYAYSLVPTIGFTVIKTKYIKLNASLGSGIGYLSKKYDKTYNPLNNAIGSHINNHTYFDIALESIAIHNYGFRVGYQLSHLSNSRTSTPNTGINMHGWQFGLIRKWDNPHIKQPTTFSANQTRSWTGEVMLGYGILQHTFRGGSRYAAYFANAGLAYRWSHYISSTLGLEYDYNQSIFQFHNQDFDSDNIARQKATKTSAFFAQKLRFGYVAMRFQGGYYLPFPEAKHDSTPHYIRIGLDIHPLKGKNRVDPYIGISIKSHKAVAQYLGIYLGSQF